MTTEKIRVTITLSRKTNTHVRKLQSYLVANSERTVSFSHVIEELVKIGIVSKELIEIE